MTKYRKFGRRDDDGLLYISKDEAMEIMESLCRHKEFWINDLGHHHELLQCSLDELYNHEGNDYTVGYQDSQNGSRLTIHCGPCNAVLTSYDPFMSHNDGKNHKKKVSGHFIKKESERLTQDITKPKPFNQPKDIYEPGSLEHKLDQSKEYVLGLQFIYQERLENPYSTLLFTCQLCGLNKVEKQIMFDHLTKETAHNRKYMKVKFGTSVVKQSEYDRKCAEYEQLEGKVTHLFTDFTRQNMIINRELGLVPQKPISPPPTPNSRRTPSPDNSAVNIPLVNELGVQTDPDELDEALTLEQELELIKINNGEDLLSNDKAGIELLMQSLQTLNLKMSDYYKREQTLTSQPTNLQKYLVELNEAIQFEFKS